MEVQRVALSRALLLLKAAGVQFAVIDANGVKHGDLDVLVVKTRTRTPSKFPIGSITDYFLPMVKNMQSGDCVVIPYGQFGAEDDDKERLRSAVSSHCSRVWGKKTYITGMGDRGVELLRVE